MGKLDPASTGPSFAHAAKIDDFLAAIVENRPPTVSAEDAAHAIEVLDAAYRSSESGQTVHLPRA